MLIPNSCRHYPLYSAKVLLVDGRVGFTQGEAEDSMLYVAGDEKDILAVEITMQEANHTATITQLWADGKWQKYDKETFEKLVKDAQLIELEDEPEDEVEDEIEDEIENEVEDEVENGVKNEVEDEVESWPPAKI